MEKLFAGDGEVKVDADVIDLETRLSVIQALIPLGLEAVTDVLQQEVEQLAGVRYARKGSEQSHRRWGRQKGSVYLMDQKLPVDVPRVRDVESDTEISLLTLLPVLSSLKTDPGVSGMAPSPRKIGRGSFVFWGLEAGSGFRPV